MTGSDKAKLHENAAALVEKVRPRPVAMEDAPAGLMELVTPEETFAWCY